MKELEIDFSKFDSRKIMVFTEGAAKIRATFISSKDVEVLEYVLLLWMNFCIEEDYESLKKFKDYLFEKKKISVQELGFTNP